MTVNALARWLVAASIFLSVSRIQEVIRGMNKLHLLLIFASMALVIFATSMQRWVPRDLGRHWIPKLLAVIVLFAVVGIPFSIYPGKSWTFFQSAFARTLLLAVMVWGISRTPGGTRFMVKTIVVSAVALAVLTIKFGHGSKSGRLTAAATFDANDLGLIMAVCIPLALWWTLDKKSNTMMRLVAFFGIVPLLIYLEVQTGSRGGFLGMMIAVIGVVLAGTMGGVSPLRYMATGMILAAFVVTPFLPHNYKQRMANMKEETDYNFTSPRGRVQVWQRGWQYAIDHPIFGVGINNFTTAEGHLSPLAKTLGKNEGLKWSAAHNSPLQATAELGFPAGIAYLAMYVCTPLALLRWPKRHPPVDEDGNPDVLSPLMGISFLAYLVSGFFLSFAYSDIAYEMLGIALAILMRRRGLLTGIPATEGLAAARMHHLPVRRVVRVRRPQIARAS